MYNIVYYIKILHEYYFSSYSLFLLWLLLTIIYLFQIMPGYCSFFKREKTKMNNLKNEFAFKWLEYLNNISYPKLKKLSKSDEVLILNIEYLKNYTELISQTPKRVIANYVFWYFFNEILKKDLLSSRLQEIKVDFFREITKGTKKRHSLYKAQKKCMTQIIEDMSLAVTAFYVNKNFDARKREYGLKMVEKIKISLKQVVDNVRPIVYCQEG